MDFNSTTTTTTPRPEVTEGIKYSFAFIYLVVSTIGLIPTMFLLYILLKVKNQNPSQSAFFLIAANMSACDIGQLLAQITVAFPITVFGKDVYPDDVEFIKNGMLIVDTVCYNGVLIFTFVMSFNRFTVFLAPNLNRIMFEGKRLLITIAVFWILIAFEVTLSNLLVCKKYYSSKGYFFFIICSSSSPYPELADSWLEIMRQQSYVLPIAMFCMYFVICIHLRMKLSEIRNMNTLGNQEMQNRKVEVNMLIQGAIVVCFLELQTLSFTFLPGIDNGYWYYYSSLVQNIISILNNSINFYVYLYFNPQLRRELLTVFGAKLQKITSSTNIVVTGQIPKRHGSNATITAF